MPIADNINQQPTSELSDPPPPRPLTQKSIKEAPLVISASPKSRTKIIFASMVTLILLVSITAAVALMSKRQEIREAAQEDGEWMEGKPCSYPSSLECATVCPSESIGDYCGGHRYCIWKPDGHYVWGACQCETAPQTCSCPPPPPTPTPPPGRNCAEGSYRTEPIAEAVCPYDPESGQEKVFRCENNTWVFKYNQCYKTCLLRPSPTQPPTPPSYSLKCDFCQAYDTDLNRIIDPSTIKVGQTVFFTTRGSTNHPQGVTKAKFRINGGVSAVWCSGSGLSVVDNWCETTNQHGAEYYIQYTIPTIGTYLVESMVFNSVLGWY